MTRAHLIWTTTLLLTAAPLAAHHGWTAYDESAVITITGTIREVAYDNPHATMQLQSEGHESQVWTVVLAPPQRMESVGLKQDGLKAGTLLTVAGYVHKQHATEMRAERITVAGKMTTLK